MASEERRAQLLELGLAVFSGRPYDEVSIDAVAEAAGISKGLLYHYFPTKREFYSAVVREAARQLLLLTDPPETMAPLERLREGLERYLDFVEARASAYATLLRGGVGNDPEVAAVIAETRAAFVERLLAGVATALPEGALSAALARTLLCGWVGFVEATSLDWIDHRDISRDALLSLWARVLLQGLPELAGI